MKFKEIINEVVEILARCEGNFITAYQICQKIERAHPDLWQRITIAYPSTDPNRAMGEGTGNYYSPASFVSHALKHQTTNNPRIVQEVLSCEGVLFGDVAPGFTGNKITIWALRA